MLRWFSACAPVIALGLAVVLVLEPPSLTPADRLPTLRLLSEAVRPAEGGGPDPLPLTGVWQVEPGAMDRDRYDPDIHPFQIEISTDRNLVVARLLRRGEAPPGRLRVLRPVRSADGRPDVVEMESRSSGADGSDLVTDRYRLESGRPDLLELQRVTARQTDTDAVRLVLRRVRD